MFTYTGIVYRIHNENVYRNIMKKTNKEYIMKKINKNEK